MDRVPFVAFSATNGLSYGADVLLLVDPRRIWIVESRSVRIAVVGSRHRKVHCTPQNIADMVFKARVIEGIAVIAKYEAMNCTRVLAGV